MVAKHDQKVAAKKELKKKTTSTKQPKSKSATEKSSKPAPAAKPKAAKEKPSKPSTAKPPKLKLAKPTLLQKTGKGKVTKVHNVKSSFQLVDEPEPEPEQEGEEYDMERAIQMSLESFQSQGHAHVGGVAIQEPVAEAIRPLLVVEEYDMEHAIQMSLESF
ncbi:putative reverse transcriptase domain-containing protein [Tanacetum coccineum]